MKLKELPNLSGLTEAVSAKDRKALVAEVISVAGRIKEFGKNPAANALQDMIDDKTITDRELRDSIETLANWNDLMQAAAGDT